MCNQVAGLWVWCNCEWTCNPSRQKLNQTVFMVHLHLQPSVPSVHSASVVRIQISLTCAQALGSPTSSPAGRRSSSGGEQRSGHSGAPCR